MIIRIARRLALSSLFPFGISLLLVIAVITSAIAQGQTRQSGQRPSAVSSPNPLLQNQPQQRLRTANQASQIQSQKAGEFPNFKRSTVPLGAINQQWAEACGQDQTTIAVAHRVDSEIRFRVRQLLGTVVTFPEPVSIVTSPGGTTFTLKAHGDDPERANIWVFGATQSGLDGNYVFVGSSRSGMPTMYLLRVQAESYKTQHCPDLMVLVKPSTSPALANAASAMQEWVAAMNLNTPRMAAAEVTALKVNKVPGSQGTAEVRPERDATGRQSTDWIEGKPFDAAALDFRWKVRSPNGSEADFIAPDIVFSDCCNTYLQFDAERIDKVRIAGIHAVELTGSGLIDAPVNWSMKGNTIVVQGVQKLTLEREGIVVCIDPDDALVKAPVQNHQRADAE